MRPLCVLLHGYPNAPSVWKDQLPEISKHFDVMNLAIPGSDTGKVKQGELNLNFLIDSISAKIASDAHEEVVLIGHDIGSFILSEVSKKLGDKVRAQIFLAGMDFRLFRKRLKTSHQPLKSWYVLLFQTPVLPEKIVPKIKNLLAKAVYHDSADLSREAPYGFTPVGIYRELNTGFERTKDEKGKSPIPTLFLFGEKDRYISTPDRKDIDHYYEQAELKVIPGSHWFMRENPELVNRSIADFIRKQNLSGDRA